jgi:hypothetical protein
VKYHRLIQISFLIVLGLSVGCVKKDSGYCPPPQEELQWVYMFESNGLMSATKCMLCDTSVEPGDYYEWARENSVNESGGPAPESATPCLYVYTGEGRNWESKEDCSEMACKEDPNVGDGVGKGGGAWRVIEEILGNPSAALNDPEQNDMMIGSLEGNSPQFQAQPIENNDLASVSN